MSKLGNYLVESAGLHWRKLKGIKIYMDKVLLQMWLTPELRYNKMVQL